MNCQPSRDAEDITKDSFLGGRLSVLQPKKGYRAGSDAVLLAASVRAYPGQSVLELGCGTGAAALCLMARVGDLALTGIEAQENYAGLARQSARLNQFSMSVVTGQVEAMPQAVTEQTFDHVITNPPYYDSQSVTAPAAHDRRIAHLAQNGMLDVWINAGRRRLRPGGEVTLIHRAERLQEILAALGSNFGDIDITPVTARSDRAATRVIIRARKGSKGPLMINPPLVMHLGAAQKAFSPKAEGILAHGNALN